MLKKSVDIYPKLPLCHRRRSLPFHCGFRQFPADAYCGIRRDGHDRNLVRLPARCHITGSRILAVGTDLAGVDDLPRLDAVANRHTLERPALDFLIDRLCKVIVVKLDDCFAPVALDPYALDASEHIVPVMVIEQYANLAQAGNVYCSGAVVKDLRAPRAFVWLLGRKRKLKLPLIPFAVERPDRTAKLTRQWLIRFRFPRPRFRLRLRVRPRQVTARGAGKKGLPGHQARRPVPRQDRGLLSSGHR